jgi:hypothetical protein
MVFVSSISKFKININYIFSSIQTIQIHNQELFKKLGFISFSFLLLLVLKHCPRGGFINNEKYMSINRDF